MIRADSVEVAYPLFQVDGGGSIPTSALQLWIEPVNAETAKQLVRAWHSRLPRIDTPIGMLRAGVCYGAEYRSRWYAAAIWTNPVARDLPQHEWLELRRLAISSASPKNTASRMLSVMVRLIRKTRPHITRLVSYQDTDVHTGCIYKAAGWVPTRLSAGDTWERPNRKRGVTQSASPKQRWELALVA